MWHTHLKKRLPQNYLHHTKRNKTQPKLDLDSASESNQDTKIEQQEDPMKNFPIHASSSSSSSKEENTLEDMPLPQSPHQCSSDMSSLTTSDNNSSSIINNHGMLLNVNDIDTPENNLALDEDFWSEVLSSDNSSDTIGVDFDPLQTMSPLVTEEGVFIDASSSNMCDGMDFWCNVYARADEFTQLLEL